MVNTHVHIESQPGQRSNDSVNGRPDLIPAGNADDGKLSQTSYRAHVYIRSLVRVEAILAVIGKPVLAFHDWISDPPMTERDRIKHYIVETRKASKKRRLAGR